MSSSKWGSSDRKKRLPKDWSSIRRRVFREKGDQCYVVENDIRCTNKATDIDHLHPGDDNSMENLAPICRSHHDKKSSREGHDAYRRMMARSRWRVEKQFGWKEDHPGTNPDKPFRHPWQT